LRWGSACDGGLLGPACGAGCLERERQGLLTGGQPRRQAVPAF
jgi:hypothetical protein